MHKEGVVKMQEKKIKILEAIDSYLPVVDGPINVVTNYASCLSKKEDCSVAAPRAKRKLHYVDNVDYKVFRCRSLGAPESYRTPLPMFDKKFRNDIKNEHFDIIHVHSPFTLAKHLIKTAKKQNIPIVLTLHTQYKEDFKRVFKHFKPMVGISMSFIMRTINHVDAVWTVNDASCKILRDYGFKGKIDVVRNGTDFKYPENAKELVKRVNEIHGLEGQKNVFLFVGRISFYKNITLMAKSLKILKDQGEDFKMIIVGGGWDEEAYKKQIRELGLEDRFIFTGKITDKELLQAYYLRSDLFLFPSTFDTSSLSPIEAAAHKLPTLLIEGSYTAENIVDKKNGFLAKENAEDYANKIKEIIDNQKLLKEVGEEAHKNLYRSWEMVCEEVDQKYREIIKNFREKQGKSETFCYLCQKFR